MAKIFDIAICPVCKGKKQIDGGQQMKDTRIYLVKKQCQKCHGHGRIGIKRNDPEVEMMKRP
jgi:DnaJ-class molecular chaperone